MIDSPRHSVSVAGIVVRDDGRILGIERRDTSRWEPPGGILELGETFEDGVRREVAEETGVSVTVERLTGVYKNLDRGIVALVFRCRAVGGEPAPTDESRRVRWLTPDEVTTCMAPAFAIRVLDALTDGAAFRAHDGVDLVGNHEAAPVHADGAAVRRRGPVSTDQRPRHSR